MNLGGTNTNFSFFSAKEFATFSNTLICKGVRPLHMPSVSKYQISNITYVFYIFHIFRQLDNENESFDCRISLCSLQILPICYMHSYGSKSLSVRRIVDNLFHYKSLPPPTLFYLKVTNSCLTRLSSNERLAHNEPT